MAFHLSQSKPVRGAAVANHRSLAVKPALRWPDHTLGRHWRLCGLAAKTATTRGRLALNGREGTTSTHRACIRSPYTLPMFTTDTHCHPTHPSRHHPRHSGPTATQQDAAPSNGSRQQQSPQQQQSDLLRGFQWAHHWWPVQFSATTDPSKPHAIELCGRQLVLWRDTLSEQYHCMEDACPHR